MTMYSAVFLDRDGTIVEDRGSINKPSDIVFFPESFKALDILQKFFLLFIITNQSGISRGITSEKEVGEVNTFIIESLKTNGITISEIYCCPHKSEDNCICKKPSPYFINEAAGSYNLNLADSFIIGDHPSDVYCGVNAGVSPIYLLTGHGRKHLDDLPGEVRICENILDAAYYVINNKIYI
jgi:D-glycero-D-manno-heptose 1,7-bisphosphate phosphatase